MSPTISAVIPVFNRADWIDKTLDRILSQTVPVEEVVICDDGSTDNLADALAPYGDKVKLVRIDNSGPAVARKTAIEHASGDWIALCDSDDFWEENHIEAFWKAKTAFPGMNFYFSDFWQTDNSSQSKLASAPEHWLSDITETLSPDGQFILCNQRLYSALLKFQPCFQSALLFERDLYETVGGISPLVSRWGSEDFHLTIRMAAVAVSVVNKVPSVLINKHGGNFSSNMLANFAGRLNILEDVVDKKLVPENRISETIEDIAYSKRELFRLYYWYNRYPEALSMFKKSPKKLFVFRDYLRLMILFFRRGKNS